MNDPTTIPHLRPATVIAAEKAEAQARASQLEAEEKEARRREAAMAKERARQEALVADAKAKADAVFDRVYATMEATPYPALAVEVMTAMLAYKAAVGDLDRQADQVLARHPLSRYVRFLELFAPRAG
jgi:hypothetical protein